MNKLDLLNKASLLRFKLGEDEKSPIDIFALAHSIEKLTIIFYPMGENLSGLCIKSANNNVIAINSAMTLGRQRFTMAHEFYHLFFDSNMTTVCAQKSNNKIEKDADQFASYFLMPYVALHDLMEKIKNGHDRELTVYDIVKVEQHFGMSRQATLNRLVDEGYLTAEAADGMKTGIINSATRAGYDDKLYRPNPVDEQYKTLGFFIRQAERAMDEGLISVGKYEELLLSAYRPDLVYGDEDGEIVD